MKSNQKQKILFLVLVSFAIYYLISLRFKAIKVEFDNITHNGLASYVLTYLVVGIPIFIGTYLIDRKTSIFKSLGLSASILTGIWTSLLFTLPMFIGGLLFFKFSPQIDVETLIAGTLIAGFMEELYFRGFLFGQLFKNINFGFIPSIFFGALIFAFGHLYQSNDINELIGIFMITFSGAVLFAWLYVEWNYNLWVPIFTHTLMNLSWNIFEVDNSALGGMKGNIIRGLTILTAILFTILYKRKRNQKMSINRQTLFLNRKNSI